MISKDQKVALLKLLTPKEVDGLVRAFSRDDLKLYFFKTKSDLKWFEPLRVLGCMDPALAPAPFEAEKGLFTLPTWPILFYLDNAVKLMTSPGENPYRTSLINFMRAVTAQGIDNSTTAYFFIKYLKNFSITDIPEDLSELSKKWLATRFRAAMVDAELLSKLLPQMLSQAESRSDIDKVISTISSIASFKIIADPVGTSTRHKKAQLLSTPYWFQKFAVEHIQELTRKTGVEVVRVLHHRLEEILLAIAMEVPVASFTDKHELSMRFENEFITVSVTGSIDSALPAECRILRGTGRASFVRTVDKELQALGVPSSEIMRSSLELAFVRLHDSLTIESSFAWSLRNSEDAEDVVTTILLHALRELVSQQHPDLPNFLNDLVEENFLIFPKLALHCVAFARGWLDEVFWKALRGNNGDLLLEGMYFGDEIRRIFENFQHVDGEKTRLLIDRIESGPRFWRNDENAKQKSLWKQARYEALAAVPFFRQRRDALYLETGQAITLRPGMSISVEQGYGNSPYSADDITSMDAKTLMHALVSSTSGRADGALSPNALSEALYTAVCQSPTSFILKLSELKCLPYLHFVNFLRGIRDGFAKLSTTDISTVTAFVNEYTSDNRFWSDNYPVVAGDEWKTTHLWALSEIGVYFETIIKRLPEGAKDDIKVIKPLLQRLLGNLTLSDTTDNEPLSHAYNSPGGRLLGALLLAEQVETKKTQNRLIGRATLFYLARQARAQKPDALTLVGRSLLFLFKKEPTWSQALIRRVERLPQNWIYFLIGYLHTPRIDRALYERMKPLCARGLRSDQVTELDREQLVHRISIAYLNNFDDGLFAVLVNRQQVDELGFVVQFFWQLGLRHEEAETARPMASEQRTLILNFWDTVIKMYDSRPDVNKELRKFLSATALLLVHLPMLGEESRSRVILAARHVTFADNTAFFLEYLDRAQKAQPSLVAATIVRDALLEMIKHGLPIFDKAHLRSLVSFLSTYSETIQDAYEICEQYSRGGYDVLEDLAHAIKNTGFQMAVNESPPLRDGGSGETK